MRSVMTASPKPTRLFGRLIAVLTQMLFALVIIGGTGTASAGSSTSPSGAVSEEDERPVEDERPRSGVRVCVTRTGRLGGLRHALALGKLEIPQVLMPTASVPETPSWQRPRRTAPDDDDDTTARL